MSEEPSAEGEERNRQLIETSPAPINLFDADGVTLWGNDAVVDLLGLDSRAELVGRPIFEFIHPEDRYTAERELLAVVEEKRSTGPTAMTLHRDDGEVRDVRVSTAPGRYDGRDIGQAVVIDDTPLNEVRADLEAERRFVEHALDSLQDVFYVVDTDGDLQRWNRALLEVSGYDEATVRRMDVEEFFVSGDADRVAASIGTAVHEGQDVLEATVRTARGREIPFEFRKRRLVEDGEVTGVVGIGRDVSDRKARDTHLRAVDRLLQHNLRNKLNLVLAANEELREDASPAAERHVEQIDAATEGLLSIFEHHRYIVDLLTGRAETEPRDLASIVDTVVRDVEEAHPEVDVTVSRPESAVVSGVLELERAVFELVENAVVHNDRPAPSVEVVVTAAADAVSLRVADDGPTIPAMEREVVAGEAPGLPTFHPEGLGLWFVRWAVERSGGHLRFDANEPRGNVVTVELLAPGDRWG